MNVQPKQGPIQKRSIVVNEQKNAKLTEGQKKAILESGKTPDTLKEQVSTKNEQK